jgi:RimJ/RimL family protein N-acetyltransferase
MLQFSEWLLAEKRTSLLNSSEQASQQRPESLIRGTKARDLRRALDDALPMNLNLGNGLRVTEFRRSDRDALLGYLSDREIYANLLSIPHTSRATDAPNWSDATEQAAKLIGQDVHWAIRDETGALIGGVGLKGLQSDHPHRAEIGYWLARPFWNRGIMTSVVRAVCDNAFDVLGLVKITAHVFSFNNASARVLEKCGFVQEGFCPKHFEMDGEFIDVKWFGLVRRSSSS